MTKISEDLMFEKTIFSDGCQNVYVYIYICMYVYICVYYIYMCVICACSLESTYIHVYTFF